MSENVKVGAQIRLFIKTELKMKGNENADRTTDFPLETEIDTSK